jgi:putative transposase
LKRFTEVKYLICFELQAAGENWQIGVPIIRPASVSIRPERTLDETWLRIMPTPMPEIDECRHDSPVVADALLMAVWRRGKPNELLHHSDQGSQYTSEQFQRLMADSGIVCSMSRSGNVWDNAAMESFFSSLKTERTARKIYRTRNEARADVFDCIERFYNVIRRHSTIGHLSPVEFEREVGLA